jgi:DNA-binding transcriptional MerR regulator
MVVARYFSSKEVLEATGIRYRQLDYWIRCGIVCASGRAATGNGSRRLFTFTDLVEVRAVQKLTASGMRPKALKKCILHLRAHLPQLISSRLGSYKFVTDGKSVFIVLSENTVEDISKSGQFCFAFGIDEEMGHVTRFVQMHKRPHRYQRASGDMKVARPSNG